MGQQEELSRVADRIGEAILAFAARQGSRDFHADDLRRFVAESMGDANIAPGSPDRILRDLRQRGELDYVILNRSASLYRFTHGEGWLG